MVLPCRELSDFPIAEFADLQLLTIACINSEDRCLAIPSWIWKHRQESARINLIEIASHPDGIPDYSEERRRKIINNRKTLAGQGVEWVDHSGQLIATEDELLQLGRYCENQTIDTVILDITAMPKRYFCFFLRHFIQSKCVGNVLVTYTEAGPSGYTSNHLAEDVMTHETLPGFAGKLPGGTDHLVISVGFESLGLRKLILSLYGEVSANLRILLPFPAPLETVRRQWSTLRAIVEDDPDNLRRQSFGVVAAWDSEYAYKMLQKWAEDGASLSLAPFGPKPHTLAMALFAIQHDVSLWYTQPKVYHPDYTIGIGPTRIYTVKWKGVSACERRSEPSMNI